MKNKAHRGNLEVTVKFFLIFSKHIATSEKSVCVLPKLLFSCGGFVSDVYEYNYS